MVLVVVGVLLAVVLVVVVRRRSGGEVQRVQVEGPRPWAGPSFLNGSQRVRLPSALPRPGELLPVLPAEATELRGRVRLGWRGWAMVGALLVVLGLVGSSVRMVAGYGL